jgi:ATP-binding cassette, subfamily B, multidrug efflux pump
MFSFFEKLIDPFPSGPQSQPPDTLFAFCWHYSKGIWPYLVLISLLATIISVLEVMLFGFLGNIVDWLSLAKRETFLADEGGQLIFMALVVLVLLPAVSAVHSLIHHQTMMGNYPMIVRWLGHRYLLGQSYSFYQDDFAGRIATKLMQSANGVHGTVVKILDVIVYVTVYFSGAVILVASIDLWLALPFLLWFGVYVLLMRIMLPKFALAAKKLADARSVMTGRIVDSYTNIMTVKLFAHAGREEAYGRESMEGLLAAIQPMFRQFTILEIALQFLNAVLLFSVSAMVIWSWTEGTGTVGAVAVGIGLVLKMSGMSHWIMWELAGLFQNIGTVRDGMTVLAKPRTVLDQPDAQHMTIINRSIKFDNIRFHYGKQSGVIENLSLTIKPGEKVGIVGRSGSGKTTLMNLLLRLYDLEGGRILVDGQDIATIKQDTLRAQIGVVTQDSSLLHRSVSDNIAYGASSATHEEVLKAAKRANAHEFIEGLEDKDGRKGFDAKVGERGVKLSGGQRQRISIARMFLKDAPILLLDEATSALDSEVEAAIQENLFALMEGKTVIAIAHRLSTISSLDRLVVMDKGEIIEQGTHEELVASGGLYASLWNRQSGGFLAEQV